MNADAQALEQELQAEQFILEIETEDEPTIYTTDFACMNCSKINILHIPIGTTVKAFTRDLDCKFCKCWIFPRREN